MTDAEKRVITWLESQHAQIIACEQEALALLAKGDKGGYRKKMQEKAQLLAALANKAGSVLAELPEPLRSNIAAKLSSFAESAKTSLALDSIFYMSALLYPDDHKKGDPDNLQRLIGNLKNSL